MRASFATDLDSCGLSVSSDNSTACHHEREEVASVACYYRHDPYSLHCGQIRCRAPTTASGLATLHTRLAGHVTFVPYPAVAFPAPAPVDIAERASTTRLFLGQLPFAVTDMQLDWLCATFAAGASVYFPERIVKRDRSRNRSKRPTGCLHVYCPSDSVAQLVSALHKRVLFDDTGIWYAVDAAEMAALDRYCNELKLDASLRIAHRPHDSVVVQLATSQHPRASDAAEN